MITFAFITYFEILTLYNRNKMKYFNYFFTPCAALIFICLLANQSAQAQSDYLITNRGDSIAGEIKLLFYGPEKKVLVKTANAKETYSILDTRYFFYKDEKFVPVRTPNGYSFMKIITPGYLSLYAFQMDKQSAYDGRFLVKADGESMEVPNLGFKKQLTKFLSDCGDVAERVDSGELSKKELDTIIAQYNACIEKKTAKITQKISEQREAVVLTNKWDALQTAVKEADEFDGKANALEMITDIKNKISHNEKIPNYVMEGLKNILAAQPNLAAPLEKALAELN